MSKRHFTPAQRFALWKHHHHICALCQEPLRLAEMTVDHAIPESLAEDSVELQKVLIALGLPASFMIDDYCNWQPAHFRCNRQKGDRIFRATPVIQTPA